jgi:hypothetical protein
MSFHLFSFLLSTGNGRKVNGRKQLHQCELCQGNYYNKESFVERGAFFSCGGGN